MSDSTFRQFFPAPSTAPVAPIRDKASNYVGGSALDTFNDEVEDLARVLFAATRFVTIAEALRNMPAAYSASLAIVLNRYEFTQEFTTDEKARNAEQAEQKARNAKFHAEAAQRGEAIKEAARVDLKSRNDLAEFKPRSFMTQRNSPAWAIERGHFIQALNVAREKSGLPPLSA